MPFVRGWYELVCFFTQLNILKGSRHTTGTNSGPRSDKTYAGIPTLECNREPTVQRNLLCFLSLRNGVRLSVTTKLNYYHQKYILVSIYRYRQGS